MVEPEFFKPAEVLKLGHPQPCTARTCQNKLRLLRAASVHYPLLRRLLENVYMARCCHNFVKSIDEALHTGTFNGLCKLNGINYMELIDEDAEMYLNEGKDKDTEALLLSSAGLPHIETQLQLTHAATIEEYHSKLNDDPEHACVSCH